MIRFEKPGSLSRAFTLIELLIVVAIIAILAAIAVPNFLEAQTRAKVSRAKADLRTMSTGIEQYRVDYNGYPDIFTHMHAITTPVAYISQLPRDVFRVQQAAGPHIWGLRTYRYGAMPLENPSRYALDSVGPDTDIDTYINSTQDTDNHDAWEPYNGALRFYPGYTPQLFGEGASSPDGAGLIKYIAYDPTNGTISDGDVFRLSDFQMQ